MNKPVAYQYGESCHFRKQLHPAMNIKPWRPLYTVQPLTNFVGLTEEEVMEIYNSDKWEAGHELVRLTEKKLKEKNT